MENNEKIQRLIKVQQDAIEAHWQRYNEGLSDRCEAEIEVEICNDRINELKSKLI
jgi:hypothetical protein